MQKTGIVEPQQRPDDGVVFVARAGDGVKTLIAFLQFARGDIEQPAGDLILENRQRLFDGQTGGGTELVGLGETRAGRLRLRQKTIEVVLNDLYASCWCGHWL